MSTYYIDTSAVIKHYHNEPGSDWIREQIDARDDTGFYLHPFFLGEIAIAEAAAAFAILARTQQIDVRVRDSMFRNFIQDIVARYQTLQITRKQIESAATLTLRHPLKAYDAIQLAIALDLQNELRELDLNMVLVTSDRQLFEAAQVEGLQVENPLAHDSI